MKPQQWIIVSALWISLGLLVAGGCAHAGRQVADHPMASVVQPSRKPQGEGATASKIVVAGSKLAQPNQPPSQPTHTPTAVVAKLAEPKAVASTNENTDPNDPDPEPFPMEEVADEASDDEDTAQGEGENFVEDLGALVQDTPDAEHMPATTAHAVTVDASGMPLVYHPRVQRIIDYFQNRGRERFEVWLSRSGAYIPLMQKILVEEGLPSDLVYLALIESGFSPYARSHAAAVGYWQFIASTGRRYGLRIDGWVDERRNAVKATRAAARYLKDLYAMFGDWHLAAAGYNAGEGKISRAIRMYDTTSYWELLAFRYLKPETKDYVPKLIAAITIAKNPKAYGFNPEYKTPLQTATVSVRGGEDLTRLAYAAGITLGELKRLNPELRRWATPPDVAWYELHLPLGADQNFAEKLAAVPPHVRTPFLKVRLGKRESLATVARRYRFSLDDLHCLNPNVREQPGATVLLPMSADGTRYAERPPAPRYRTRLVYKVRPGDTLNKIAKRYRVSPSLLAEFNGLTSNYVKPGTKLKIPGKVGAKKVVAKKKGKSKGQLAAKKSPGKKVARR